MPVPVENIPGSLSDIPGRPMPLDEKAMIHWQTRLVTQNSGTMVQTLRNGRSSFVSPGIITIPGKELGFQKGVLVRDPDGHVMALIED
jgi:hypothetical protein